MSFTPIPAGFKIYDAYGNVISDSIGFSLVTSDIDHLLIHSGRVWVYSDLHSVANAATLDFLIHNSGTLEVHLKEFEFTSSVGNAVIILYASPTITANGTAKTLINKHLGHQADNPESDLYEGPTITAVGLQSEHFQIVGGKQTGGSIQGGSDEWVIPAGYKILMRYTNNGPGTDSVTVTMKLMDIPAHG